jgi:hypothetical protein
MRIKIAGMLVVTGATLAALPASAAPLGDTRVSPLAGTLVEQVQMSRYCRRLQRACEFKHERGEAGEGNCRRYRRECGGRW